MDKESKKIWIVVTLFAAFLVGGHYFGKYRLAKNNTPEAKEKFRQQRELEIINLLPHGFTIVEHKSRGWYLVKDKKSGDVYDLTVQYGLHGPHMSSIQKR